MSINAHMLDTISNVLPSELREGVSMQPGMALGTATGPTADAHGSGPLMNVVKGMMALQGVEATYHLTAPTAGAPVVPSQQIQVQQASQPVRPAVTTTFKAPKI
jgi:hypothetical protein